MEEIRAECKEQGLIPMYHYTHVDVVPYIFDNGFRLHAGARSDGGVHFSQLGPASYGIGTPEYEENIILDCFGPGKMAAYKNKNWLDAVFVYGAEPRCLKQSPGSLENAKMFSKVFFEVKKQYCFRAFAWDLFLRFTVTQSGVQSPLSSCRYDKNDVR